MLFGRPKIEKILSDELYQTEREVVGQAERLYRLTILADQAKVHLDHSIRRRDDLRKLIREETGPSKELMF